MTNNPKPDNGPEFKVKITKTLWQGSSLRARNTCSGKESPCNPGKGTNASLRTVQRSKAKRCEAGPGKVQRSKVKSVQGRPRGDVSKKQQGVQVDCCNIMVMERKSGRPFEVLHGPTISSGKYEHSPRVGVALSEGQRST